MSKLGQLEWWTEIGTKIAQAWVHVNGNRRAQEGEEITFKTASGDEFTAKSDADGNFTVDGHSY